MHGSNLHALWDSGLIRYVNEDAETMSTRMLAQPLSDQAHDPNVVHATQESCRTVGMPRFYTERKVGLDYISRFMSTMEQRLALAGTRLAHMLNRALNRTSEFADGKYRLSGASRHLFILFQKPAVSV